MERFVQISIQKFNTVDTTLPLNLGDLSIFQKKSMAPKGGLMFNLTKLEARGIYRTGRHRTAAHFRLPHRQVVTSSTDCQIWPKVILCQTFLNLAWTTFSSQKLFTIHTSIWHTTGAPRVSENTLKKWKNFEGDLDVCEWKIVDYRKPIAKPV